MFDAETRAAITRVAQARGWEPAALLAVADVESGGTAFVAVNGRNEPPIRFEGHYFDRRLSGDKREAARRLGLASPRAGEISNPRSQAGRWKLLDRAAGIDAEAAFESTSWGVGQVMGAHWAWLGFSSVAELVELCRKDVRGQVEIMARYIDKAALGPALLRRDWERFARGYNGPGYRRHGYHHKLATAYLRYSHAGAEDSDIGRLQEQLTRHGFAVSVDGIAGPETRRAIRRFQQANGLAVDGIAGPATRVCLERPPTTPAAPPARLPPPAKPPAPARPGMLAVLIDLFLALFRRN